MAVMIPDTLEDDHGSFGERQVFEALKNLLSDDYVVFHSVRWNSLNEKNTVIWGECDFTIFHPENGFIVLEVKSGGIECMNGRWTYIRTDNGERHTMKRGPLEQADREIRYKFKDLVSEILGENPVEPQYALVEPAVWFPSISKRDLVGSLPMEYQDQIVLYENALDNPQTFIQNIYDFYGGRKHTRLNNDSCRKLINAFAPYYSAIPSLRSKRDEQKESFARLTREQNYLLDYLEEQPTAAIQGSAGTGKTMLALEKAKRLSASGRVLFLCFNKHLKNHLQEIGTRHPERYQNVDFYNLPQLVCSMMGVPSVENDDIIAFLSHFENYEWPYKHIVIDEGQDFSDEAISKLYDISVLQEGSFYIFYDKKQFVQGREFPKWLEKAECRLVLSINCRNTFQIADTSGKPLEIIPKVKNRSVIGDTPIFHICGSEADARKVIGKTVDRLRAANYPYNQICILTLKTEATSILSGVKKVGNHEIHSNRGSTGVLFTTSRKFKGLESDAIIIIDVDSSSFSDADGKMLFYVGSSRAKHQLDIVFVGDERQLETLGQELSPQRFPNGRIGIARCLNVKPVIE